MIYTRLDSFFEDSCWYLNKDKTRVVFESNGKLVISGFTSDQVKVKVPKKQWGKPFKSHAAAFRWLLKEDK